MAKDKMGLYLVDARGNSHELRIISFKYGMKHSDVDLRVAGADADILDSLLRATYHVDELPPEEDGKNETE